MQLTKPIQVTKSKPWSYDVWSLGIMLLEIATGCPIGFYNKCIMVRATSSKDPLLGKGVFGVKNSDVKRLL